MNSPQPSIPPLPLSPSHRSLISQSQSLNTKVTQFLKNPLQIPMNESQKLSVASSLDNSRTYLQSEINYLMNVVKQTNKLYQSRQSEMKEMKKKIKEYQEKIFRMEHEEFEQEVNRCREGIENWKKNNIMEKEMERQNKEGKTRKKTAQNEENDNDSLIRPMKDSISPFQLCPRTQSSNKPTISKPINISRLQNEVEILQRVHQLQSKLSSKNQQTHSLQKQLKEVKFSLSSSKEQVIRQVAEKEKLLIECKMMKSRYDTLQKQYNQLEEKYGRDLAEKSITIQNLRELLRNIESKRSPQKKLKKQQQGYYSINRVIKKNQSLQSLSSASDQSLSRQKLGYSEKILREENQLLRTQLIKAFDEKGAMISQLKKYKKLATKLEAQTINQRKRQSKYNDENNQDQSNVMTQDRQENIFKKNKASTILVVQNTEKKQKHIIQQQKISNLLTELSELVNILSGECINEMRQLPGTRRELLQIMVRKMTNFIFQYKQIREAIQNIQVDNQRLKRQKILIQEKAKRQVNELQLLLKQVRENPLNNLSSDSTDQAFRNIQLGDFHLPLNSHKKDPFSSRQQQYLHKISQQQNQLSTMRNRITSLQQASQSFNKLTAHSPSSHINPPSSLGRGDQIIHVNSVVSAHQERGHQQSYMLEVSSFEMFKQKLTEFYQYTIKQLDQWQVSALKNYCSPMKRFPEINDKIIEPISYQIPHIVKRNVLKISREFRSIKNDACSEEDKSQRNFETAQNQFFQNKKMSQSFFCEDKKQETLEEIINKRLSNFQQFSSNWIQKVISKVPSSEKSSETSQKPQDLTLKQQAVNCPSAKRMHFAMTERPSVQRQKKFELDMNEIDAKSESVTSRQLMRERQLFIRKEISYYMPNKNSMNRMFEDSEPKKSYHSFRI